MSFDALAIEAKVAMVRVAKNVGPPEGPLKATEPRVYLPLTNETLAIIRDDYSDLKELSDDELTQALKDIEVMNN